jgi:hypothetical protein
MGKIIQEDLQGVGNIMHLWCSLKRLQRTFIVFQLFLDNEGTDVSLNVAKQVGRLGPGFI